MAKQHRVASVKDIKDGGLLEVSIGENKILLSKVKGGDIHATSAKCTHYGAPLSKGVLTPEGRLICPWHGACFKVQTGDIEDAPALNALKTFKVTVEGEDVFVTAEDEDLKDTHRKPSYQCKSASKQEKHVVIAGGGCGAVGAIEGLRLFGYDGKITVLSKEPYLPIDRTKLSKELTTNPEKILLRSEQDYKDLDVNIQLNEVVKSVDSNAKTVQTESGKSISYTSLILSTGGTPKKLPLDGFDLENIFVVRSISDTKQITEAVNIDPSPKNIVIVGTSFIGIEVATCLSKEKKHKVTCVGMDSVPFESILGERVGKFLQKLQESNGVEFYLKADIKHAEPSEQDAKKVGAIRLKDGSIIPADVVVLGVGVTPETSYLKNNSQFTLNKDSSLCVDQYMKVKGVENVYAIGDIAKYPNHQEQGAEVRVEHWDVAMNHGRTAALDICQQSQKFTNVPYFWSAQGQQLRYCGNTNEGYDDVVIQGDVDQKAFAAFYTRDQRVVAVFSTNYDPVVSKSSELIRVGKMPSKKELEGGLDVRTVTI
ncbi:hypothetical protein AKO1_008636 [Acrasis kona]|uniref:Rieske domain-containing protein n=1 Tax=Acrasis kona TaxID=1008807 RepID=A0AAW2ZED0_9EUKA